MFWATYCWCWIRKCLRVIAAFARLSCMKRHPKMRNMCTSFWLMLQQIGYQHAKETMMFAPSTHVDGNTMAHISAWLWSCMATAPFRGSTEMRTLLQVSFRSRFWVCCLNRNATSRRIWYPTCLRRQAPARSKGIASNMWQHMSNTLSFW